MSKFIPDLDAMLWVLRLRSDAKATNGTLVLVGCLLVLVCPFAPLTGLATALYAAAVSSALVRVTRDVGWARGPGREMLREAGLTSTQVTLGVLWHSVWRTFWTSSLISVLSLTLGAALGDEHLVALGTLVVPVMCILTALVAVLGSASFAQAVRPRPVRTSPGWVCLWSQNALVVRELRREARQAGPRAWHLLWSRHGTFLLVLVMLLAHVVGATEAYEVQMAACALLAYLVVLPPLRTLLSAGPVLAGEREAKTWMPLALTRLTPAEVVDGWAELLWRPRLLETVLGLCAAAALLWTGVALIPADLDCTPFPAPLFRDSKQVLLLLLPTTLVAFIAPAVAAYAGLSCSAVAGSSASASRSALLLWAALWVLWSFAALCAGFAGMLAFQVICLLALRQMAVTDVGWK